MHSSKENFKQIHIGKNLQMRVEELKITNDRIINFLNITEQEIKTSYLSESIDGYQLLRWSKLLEYDFFRLYSQHLILYSPSKSKNRGSINKNKSNQLEFRKNIYTKELIDFILERIETKEKTKVEVIEEYRIPKTTLYKWIKKYSSMKI